MNATEAKSMIGKEIWQNVNVGRLEVSDFEKLDSIVSQIADHDELREFKTMCDSELENEARSSVALRYLSSVCGRHPIDDNSIFTVLDQYYNTRLWNQAIYIAKRILQFNESPYVLRVLADCYESTGRTEDKISVWERLVRTDYDATEVVFALGEYYESRSEMISAISFYQRVMKRHIRSNDLTALKNVWDRIVKIKNDSKDFLLDLALKSASDMEKSKGISFLFYVRETCNFDVNSNIAVLKKIIETDSHNIVARDALIELFREKYKDNPRLEYCLEDTGLAKGFIDANTAICSFENEVEFVAGAFVLHESFGIGRIKQIEKDSITMVFLKGGARKMSLSMAFSSLKVLPKTNIAVLKAGVQTEKLAEKFMSDVEWGLRTVLSSYDNRCSFDKIKSELCPSEKEKALGNTGILSDSQWSTWQKEAKDILKDNAYFSITKEDKKDMCMLRKNPITFEEKQLILFRSEKDFYSKVKVLRDFISTDGDMNSDEFQSMINYFETKADTREFEAVSAYLLLSGIKEKNGIGFITLNLTFKDYYDRLVSQGSVKDYFVSLSDSEFKRSFIDNIILTDQNWQETLVELFPIWQTSYMADCIKSGPVKKRFTELLKETAENCRTCPDFFIYLAKNCNQKEWTKAGYSESELLNVKLRLLSFLAGKIENDIEAAENKVIGKKLSEMLFKNGELEKAIIKSDEDGVRRYYSMVNSIDGITFKDERNQIADFIRKNFDFADEILAVKVDKTESSGPLFPSKLLCTREMLRKKNDEYNYLKDVELPQNSKDIGEAKALGDLRENSEYQYAKDKRKELNGRLDILTEQLSNAMPVKPEDVNTTYICFGTCSVLKDNISGKKYEVTIMGPWESDPDRNIVNFQAPLGRQLYGLSAGESKQFDINGEKYDITVVSIKQADFS